MVNTMRRRPDATSSRASRPNRWTRPVAISALGALALIAMFGVPAALAGSPVSGAGFLLAFVVSGSAAALLWTADTTATWRLGLVAVLVAALVGIGGGFGMLCAALIIVAYACQRGWPASSRGAR